MLFNALLIWLVVINLIAFALMGIDKSRAKHGAWRISEKSLFLAPLLGGSIGGIAGMKFFHHKTLHWYFRYGLPAIFIAQVFLVIWVYCKFHA